MSELTLLDDTDLSWIAEIVDIVTAAAGQPWRVALERLDDTRRGELSRAPVRQNAVILAIQRILGGRARNARMARTARSLALGKPALTAAEREARIAFAASELEVSCAAVERLLWSDVPRERPVELPRGRPSEFEVAATANVQLLQRAVARAQAITLRVWGDAGPLIRAAAARGLLATLSRGTGADAALEPTVTTDAARSPYASARGGEHAIIEARDEDTVIERRGEHTDTAMRGEHTGFDPRREHTVIDPRREHTVIDARREHSLVDPRGEHTVIEIVGPLGLFHRTGVYGRALAGLVPLLADCEDFELEVLARGRDELYSVEVASPVLLPALPHRLAAADALIARLVGELARAAPDVVVTAHPPPIAAGATLVCPDLIMTPARAARSDARGDAAHSDPTYVELVGFWTSEFLRRKYERYRAAGIDNVVFCVDEARSCSHDDVPTDLPIVRKVRRVSFLAAELAKHVANRSSR